MVIWKEEITLLSIAHYLYLLYEGDYTKPNMHWRNIGITNLICIEINDKVWILKGNINSHRFAFYM